MALLKPESGRMHFTQGRRLGRVTDTQERTIRLVVWQAVPYSLCFGHVVRPRRTISVEFD